MMPVIIRQMKPDDINQVQFVAKTSWNSTYEGIIPTDIQERFIQVAYSDDMMRRRLEGSLMLVVEVEGEVVGYANFSPVQDGKIELYAIYLLDGYQGRGIGTSLLNEGIQSLDGIREVYINVEKDNQKGKNFYIAKGFEVVSEFDDDFDGHILKTVRMVLKIG